eukprot:975617_1
MAYPTVWITLIVVIVVFVLICLIWPGQHKDNKSPLAYQDIIFRPIRDMKTKYYLPSTTTYVFNDIYDEKHDEYGFGLIKSIRSNICVLQLRLYKIYLYDMHTLLSVFQHSEGTNYSKRERLASFFLYLCTIMVSSAAFYGVEQQRFGDVTASFLISLWSTVPAFITKRCFIKSAPNITPFKLMVNDVDYDAIEKKSIDLSKLPVPETDIARYDDDRFSVKIAGFKKPFLTKTVRKLVSKYGTVVGFRMHNTKKHCYVIYETEAEATKCRKKMNGMKFPKDAREHQMGTLKARNAPKLEAMGFINRVSEKLLRQQWLDAHRFDITQRDMDRYCEIWPALEAANGNFIGVDKYMMSEMVRIIFKVKDKSFHIAFLDYLRSKLLSKDQNWPHWMKYFGWIFLVVWCGTCGVLAIVYGISFDVQYDVEQATSFSKEGYDAECWTMNPQLVIENELTQKWLDESIHELNNNFGAEVGDSTSWLLQLAQSTLISICVWQPLTIYFIAWLMIWLFSWNLPVLLKPRVIYNLCQKICCLVARNAAKDEEKHKTEEVETQMAELVDNKSATAADRYSVLASRSQSAMTPIPPPILETKKRKKKVSPITPRASTIRNSTPITPYSPTSPRSPRTPLGTPSADQSIQHIGITRTQTICVSVRAKDIGDIIKKESLNDDDEDVVDEVLQFKKGGTAMVETVDGEYTVAHDMFLTCVKQRIGNTPREEEGKYDDVFEIEYGSKRYHKIVSQEQRPFDVFSFFGGDIFFLDVLKTDEGTGLDIAVYGKHKNDADKDLLIEKLELKVMQRNAVSWHDFH